MSESSEQLRATLDELHALLGAMQEVDPETQALLSSAISDLRQKLDQPSMRAPAPSEDASIIDRFREASRHFEESHPTLTGTIGSVIDALGRMGV